MKTKLHIEAIVDQPQLLNEMVSRLVYRKAEASALAVFPDWNAANVSTAETYLSGSLVIDQMDEHFDVPFTTRFFFTCLQQNNNDYAIEWCHSLS